MKKTAKALAMVLAAALTLAGCTAARAEGPELTEGEQKALEILAQELEKDAERQIAAIGEVTDLYPDLPASSPADTDSFPEKFDLRDRGILTPVKSQSPWGTCWTFGTSAACETSLLSMLGLTAEEYLEKYGVEMDISERHLAWFTGTPLPELSAYPEGKYPYDASQAGEGARMHEWDNPLSIGGSYMLSASSLASGLGVVAESIAPYESNNVLPEGADLRQGDWSLPEEYRFVQSFQLKNTNVLPSPAGEDADGNYVYRPEGTAAIKRELIRGRGVAAAYVSGTNELPDPPREERLRNYQDMLIGEDLSDEEKETLVRILIGDLDPATLPDEQLWKFIRVRCSIEFVEEGTYSLSNLSHEDLALLVKVNSLAGRTMPRASSAGTIPSLPPSSRKATARRRTARGFAGTATAGTGAWTATSGCPITTGPSACPRPLSLRHSTKISRFPGITTCCSTITCPPK